MQLYTALIYQGPKLAAEIVEGLARLVERKGFKSVADATGSELDRWTTG